MMGGESNTKPEKREMMKKYREMTKTLSPEDRKVLGAFIMDHLH
jgi:hypothetical protein